MTIYSITIDVWERINSKQIAVYRCFKTIPDNKYFVQTKDYYYMNPETGLINKDQISYFDYQHLERFFDVDPEDRKYFDSLEDSIQDFNTDWD